jgi:hypothetical protein
MMYRITPKIDAITQSLATCCWLASLQMMFQWKGKKGGANKTEDEILNQMNVSPQLYPWFMKNSGIAPSECKETAKMLGLRWSGDGEFTNEILSSMLKSYGPLWIAGMWRKNQSHVIVVIGSDPESGAIKYFDPMEPSGLESSGTINWLNNRGNVWKNCDASVMYWR